MKVIVILFINILLSNIAYASALPFLDDFSDGDYSGWTIFDIAPYSEGPSNWFVSGGVLRQTSNIYTSGALEYLRYTGTMIIAGDSSWTNYSFNANLKSTDDDGLGLIFRYKNPGKYYRYICVQDAGNGGPFKRIQRCVDSVFTTLSQTTASFSYPGGFYIITAYVNGDSIKIFENGILILSAIDTFYRAGKIGITLYANNGFYLDDVSIYEGFVIDTSENTILCGPYLQNPTDNSITVRWETAMPTGGIVYYGLTPALTDSIVDSVCTFHEVTISGLARGTRYYYGVKSAGVSFRGLDYFFRTKPFPTTRTRIAVWGDNQTYPDVFERVVNSMVLKNPDLAICTGDVVGDGDVYSQWRNELFYPGRNLFKNTAFFVSIGNHERNSHWFDDYLTQPGNEHWFAMNYGPARLIFLDTNRPYYPLTEQYNWLVSELSSSEARSAPWLLIFHHHPPYCNGWDSPGYDGEEMVRLFLVPLYELWDVDICFNGHAHNYERGEKDGVAYTINGGGGGALDHLENSWPHMTIYFAVHGYTLLDIAPTYIIFRAYDWDNILIDSTLFGTYVDITDSDENIPENIGLCTVSPNPFNSSLSIEYYIAEEENVEIDLLDISGRSVAEIENRVSSPGRHKIIWETNSTRNKGNPIPSGIYFISFRAGARRDYFRTLLIK